MGLRRQKVHEPAADQFAARVPQKPAERLIHKCKGGVRQITGNQFRLRLDHFPITLFTFAQRGLRFPPLRDVSSDCLDFLHVPVWTNNRMDYPLLPASTAVGNQRLAFA